MILLQKVDLKLKLSQKSNGIFAGVKYANILARTEKFECKFLKYDGDEIKQGDVIAKLEGKASVLLSSERTFF